MTQVRDQARWVPADGKILGRYVPEHVIKDGESVRTLLATDIDGTRVIIKTALGAARTRDRLLIEHEGTALARLTSPWIAPLIDHGWDDEGFSLVTRYVDGVVLDARVGTPVGPREVVALGISLMSALRDAHGAGVIHRDIKPSNVITNRGDAIERATLVDFGLAKSGALDPELRDAPVGTALYLAPEGSGILDGEVDERSDLYSAGIVLYHCLAGRPPFIGDGLGDVLRQHVNAKVPELRELGVDVPRAMSELIDRMLAKDPRDRYQSAEGVLADLEQIATALDKGYAQPSVIVGLLDRRSSLAEPAFVGRVQEIASLTDELDRARAGQGRVVLIEAESGGGKTRLLQEFAQRSALAGARIFRGQGIDQGAQRPFEVLRGVAQGAVQHRDDSAFTSRIVNALEHRPEAAAAALPELRELLDVDTTPAGPEAFGELRAIEALESLLTALGSPTDPALIVLDDCQWADDLTLKLLARWHAHRTAPGRHVTIAVAFRSEEAGPGHLLRAIEDPMRLELEPLRTDEVRQLVESMSGPVPDEAIRVVVELAEGSPFMASAVLRGLVETGALVDTPDGWRSVPQNLAAASASRRAGAFLARRIELLSDATRALVGGGAVLGKEFDVALAADIIGSDPHIAIKVLSEARRRHMIWMRGSRGAFVHDKVRETVLAGLSDEMRRQLHRIAADRIDVLDPKRSFEIAYHLDAAGESELAAPHAIAAAESARASNDLASAQANYEIAERGTHASPDATRLGVLEGLGDVLMLRGRYDIAGERFTQAAELTNDGLVRARLAGKLGELAFKRGDVGEGTHSLELALKALGRRTPRRFASMLLGMFWEIAVQVAHTYVPRLIRKHSRANAADMLSCELFDKLAYAYWFHRGPFHAVWAQLRGLNLAERYPVSPQLAKNMSTHVAAFSIIVPFFFKRTVRFAERSLEIWRELGDMWGEGQALHFYGVTLHSVANYEPCVEKMREAIRLLEQTGDRWEANTAAWHMAYAFHRMGDHAAAVDQARHVHRTGVEIGDAQARGISLSVWAKASGGAVPADLIHSEIERGSSDDIHTSSEVMNAEGVRLISEERYEDAAEVFEAAIARLRESKVMHVYVAPLFTWRAVARRLQAEQGSMYEQRRSSDVRRAWRRAARAAAVIARVYPTERAQAWREVALAKAADGKMRASRKAFARSIDASRAYGSTTELAATLAARADVGDAYGWEGAPEDRTEAARLASPLASRATPGEASVTVSLIDRFDTILEQGRHIASALTKDAVWDAVRFAALTLLRAERCVVCEVKDDLSGEQQLVGVAGAVGDFGTTVAWDAVRSGAPVTVSEEDAIGAVSESLVLAGVRSSLAAPVFVRGRVAAVFYVDHTGVGGLFGPDEERIAGFIAAIAGAAVENAEGFAEVQDLTRTLEKRVAERTNELEDTNERLARTLGDLQRLDQLKTEFMAMAAHDLRTPMTVITGFSATLRDRWQSFTDGQRHEFLDRIHTNTKRLAEFVENLLHFGRVESGEFSYDIKPFDLGELAIRTGIEQSTEDRQVVIHREERLPLAMGDEQRTWQVLTNLVSNALKFSPPELGVTVDIRSHDGMLEATIRDRGIGIDIDDQGKLFRKFSRIPSPNGNKGPLGTGLGLYICKSIVESQGGQIWVISAPGEGSTFGFTLPVAGPG